MKGPDTKRRTHWFTGQPLWLRLWVLSSLLSAAACSEAPFTQRQQLIFTSEEQEIALGEDIYQKTLEQLTLSPDKDANRLVSTVGWRIAQATGKTNYAWEFIVIDDPEVRNAWVLSGGKVGVYTGLFPIAQDETGLAIILAHEAAHALARHHGEKASRDVLVEVGGLGVTYGPDLLRRTFDLGTNLGVILPFGRTQEAEADYIGLILAAKAGYDPRAAIEVWMRLQHAQEQEGHSGPPEFLATHPNYETRLLNIRQRLPEALQYYESSTMHAPEQLPSLDALERPLDDSQEQPREINQGDS